MIKFLLNLFHRPIAKPAVQVPSALSAPRTAEFVFLDTETTGLSLNGTDEVLEIAIVDIEGRELLNTFVRPVHNTSWPSAEAIHGIRPQDVANAPLWKELLPTIAAICADKTVVMYNAEFDMSFFPGDFFAAVECAMRRYAEVNPASESWVKLSDAAAASGYHAIETYHRAREDALACRHIWLFGIPPLEMEYPQLIKPNIYAELELGTDIRKSLAFDNIFADQLRFVTVGCECNLWTKSDHEHINVYRPDTEYGHGKIANLLKQDNPELTEWMSIGSAVCMTLRERRNNNFFFEIVQTPPIKKTITAHELPITPITLSLIDDDIYRCFIAHKSGMCDAIGTWEEFRKVEIKIANICQSRGGRYYKSKAKGAKFAIIFSPYARTAREISKLQRDGYKVTTFDRALTYFALEDMWDCPRYLAHVESLKGYIVSLQ